MTFPLFHVDATLWLEEPITVRAFRSLLGRRRPQEIVKTVGLHPLTVGKVCRKMKKGQVAE